MKKVIFGVLLGVLSIVLFGCNSGEAIEGYEEVEGRETITIGMECDYAPFNWSQPKKTKWSLPISNNSQFADGYDIQIAKYLSRELNVNVRIKAISWAGLTTALESGEIDAIIAGMSPTEDRKVSIDFTEGYYRTTHVVVMKKDSKFVNAKLLTDFSGARGVGQIETLYDTLLTQFPGITHQPAVASVGIITTALNTGTADIAILEKPVAQSIIKMNDKLTFIELEQEFEVDESDVLVAIGIRKNAGDLKARLNAALNKLTQEMRDEWMLAAVERQIV